MVQAKRLNQAGIVATRQHAGASQTSVQAVAMKPLSEAKFEGIAIGTDHAAVGNPRRSHGHQHLVTTLLRGVEAVAQLRQVYRRVAKQLAINLSRGVEMRCLRHDRYRNYDLLGSRLQL